LQIQDHKPEDWLGRSAIEDLGPDIHGVQVWGPKTNEKFQTALLDWYDQHGRSLPWRESKSAYAVWVSEIMLQQTQVDTVIPYYQNFMQKFPDVKALAQAEEADLLKAWEGLGYYSRVRNMQAAAQTIMDDYDGGFPSDLKEIQSLKGIGPYTAGAIASIAFNVVTPAIDGNAMRVFARLFTVSADIAQAKNRKIFQALGQYLVDPKRPGDFNQAIMDLGSSYQRAKDPNPEASPLRDFNLSTLTGTTLDYPVKSKKAKAKHYYYDALVLEDKLGRVLICQRPETGLLAKLWTVPLLERQQPAESSGQLGPLFADQVAEDDQAIYDNLLAESQAHYHVSPIFYKRQLAEVKHVFSHQVWHIRVYQGQLKEDADQVIDRLSKQGASNWSWLKLSDMTQHAFPTVQMKIWQAYEKNRV
ncbi:MAG: A/G-specific adenine glycosylase, partial [Aerococcus sanguinicola]